MSEMLERAREAFMAAMKRPFGEWPREELHEPWDRAVVRAALLAALDPEDEALVEAVARSLVPSGIDPDENASITGGFRPAWRVRASEAAAVIEAINRIAQGGTEG